MAGEEAAPRDREVLRESNDKLRAENSRLRAAIVYARPDTPLHTTRSDGGAPGGEAADLLVRLLAEGARLLSEREYLRDDNDRLVNEVDSEVPDNAESVSGNEALAAAAALRAQVQEAVGAGSSDADLAALDRLMPLLSEADALKTERDLLKKERGELLRVISEAFPSEDGGCGSSSEADLQDGEELERRIRSAGDTMSRENESLQGEISQLRVENARLRDSKAAVSVVSSSRAPAPAPSAAATVTSSPPEVTMRPRQLEAARAAPAAAAAAPIASRALPVSFAAEPTDPIEAGALRAARAVLGGKSGAGSERVAGGAVASPGLGVAAQRIDAAVTADDEDAIDRQRELARNLLRNTMQQGTGGRSAIAGGELKSKVMQDDVSMGQEIAVRGALHQLLRGFQKP